ncbi:MAG: response regulator, partial [Gammaproteobacteria bacterium]
KLADAMLQGEVAHPEECIEVLMRGILQLPNYLERLQSSHQDLPVVLMPILNDLRASRGASLLSDTSLFSPNLLPLRIQPPKGVNLRLHDDRVIQQLRKLRQMFQFALINIIREQKLDEHFDYMDKVIVRLARLCKDTAQGEMWRIAAVFVDALAAGAIELSSATKHLLSQLDKRIKKLIDENIDILVQPAPEDLVKHMLYYLARSGYQTEAAQALRDAYKLDSALPSEEEVDEARQQISGPDRSALGSVVHALNEELARIKDQLDLFVRGEFKDNRDLEELLPGLTQVSNTMAVLGLGVPRKVVDDQIRLLEQLVSQDELPDDGVLMDIAGALLYVEATLSGVADDDTPVKSAQASDSPVPPEQVAQAHEAVIREARNGLEQAKTDIVEYIASQWDREQIKSVPRLLRSIRGGLQIIPLEQAANLLERAARYIETRLLNADSTPDWAQLDTLADAITSIEYYLERMAEGASDNDMILQVAEESLGQLETGESPSPSAEVEVSDTTETTEVAEEQPAGDDMVDDEIIEIFVEEAEEVLATIREHFPAWSADWNNTRALTEIRRAYHTLKGSGRLVGATDIGELAWSVENMLNRVIDGTVKPSEDMMALLGDVLDRLPELVRAFRQNQPVSGLSTLAERAEALAAERTQTTDLLGEDDSAAEAIAEHEADVQEAAGDSPSEPVEVPVDETTVAEPDEEAIPVVADIELEAASTETEATSPPVSEDRDDDDLVDDEIIEIFVEEAGEVLETINEYLPRLLQDFQNQEALTEVRRAFHTLKGSGRLVGASIVGELAWSVENMMNRIIDGTIFMNEDIAGLIREVVDKVPQLVTDFEQRRSPSFDPSALMAAADAWARGENPTLAQTPTPDTASPSDTVPAAPEAGIDNAEPEVDPVLLDIFRQETEGHLETLRAFAQTVRDSDQPVAITDAVSRALHTLKGSANTANIEPIARIAVPLERYVKDARACHLPADISMAEILAEAVELVEAGLGQLNTTPQAPLAGSEALLEAIADAHARVTENETGADNEGEQTDPQLVAIFLTEGLDILLDAEAILADWSAHPAIDEKLNRLADEIASLQRGAAHAGLINIAELCEHLERVYQHIQSGTIQPQAHVTETLRTAHDVLLTMMDQVAAGLAAQRHDDLIQALDQLSSGSPVTESTDPTTASAVAEPDSDALSHADEPLPLPEVEAEEEADAQSPDSTYELDPELAEVFLEEARDIISRSADLLQSWSEAPEDKLIIQALQRDLHTLKGGARLSQITAIGDLAHALETLLERITEGRTQASEEALNLATLTHDTLADMVDRIAEGQPISPAPDLIAALESYEGSNTDEQAETTETLSDADTDAPVKEPEIEELEALEDVPTLEPVEGLDPEMVEIFLEEARDIMHRTSELIELWSGQPDNAETLQALQRELHTLKGGARMAEIAAIGNLAHEVETLFERLVDGRLSPRPGLVDLAQQAHDALAEMVDQVESQQTPDEAQSLIEAIHRAAEADAEADAFTVTESDDGSLPEPEVSETAAGSPQAATEPSQDLAEFDRERLDTSTLDDELLDIFLEEAHELVDRAGELLHAYLEAPQDTSPFAELQRVVHTLKGGARLAELTPIGDLSHELENLFEGIAENRLPLSDGLGSLMQRCNDALAEMVELTAQRAPLTARKDLVAEVRALCTAQDAPSESADGTTVDLGAPEYTEEPPEEPAATGEHDESETPQPLFAGADEDDLTGIFLDEARDIMAVVQDVLSQWRALPDQTALLEPMLRELHTLKGGARLAHVDSVGELCDALYQRIELLVARQPLVTDDVINLIERAVRYLNRLLDAIEEGEEAATPVDLVAELRKADTETPPSELLERPKALDIDPEILQVFIEEADELMTALTREFQDWKADRRNAGHAESMHRILHTLKGGARLATLSDIGDLAQELETTCKDAHSHHQELDEALEAEINSLLERLQSKVHRVQNIYQASGAGLSSDDSKGDADKPAGPASASEAMVALQREEPKPDKTPREAPPKPAQPAQKAAKQTATQETIRVSAPLLDSLVNLAGETSIARGRLEQQISDFGFNLEEMEATIERLREQLRRLEIETEAQVLYRLEKEGGPQYEEFDPLEMDRYSTIQQLSRALAESTFDLQDLRDTLVQKARDAETILLQQSRINTELQEGLMKTRMVPFNSIVPRLRRIVRQIAGELGKKAQLNVYNAEGEVDRTVLERMVAPLEHMLRNAVDHGIEMPDVRKAAGKPETGTIDLSVAREGGDVVITIEDDGAGINVERVREKAIAQGLIRENTAISDRDVLQFIFQSGFSTAQKVTQISGRGVGMDVVSSEIKQLGGRVSIDSQRGKGTRFTVNLPFTVSVNRALMVSTGEDYYAIPLNTIEGIVRVSPYELEEYYKPNAPLYEYAGKKYRLQYLGNMLNAEHHPKLQGQPLPLPVILVRGGDEPLALQVDALMGSREIVVKSLGPQFAGVRGVSGATILGDGSVVVILDLPAMVRANISGHIVDDSIRQPEPARRDDRPTTVMVVDDSITVRKVTSRLLNRNGMEVFTAKDGVDAIAQLQDVVPDVILLDIEMPRMDGFEVASLVRHDDRLKDVPIIMITSRTGQKHRERALSIGVNEYMGKPFQEATLLETIQRLTEA